MPPTSPYSQFTASFTARARGGVWADVTIINASQAGWLDQYGAQSGTWTSTGSWAIPHLENNNIRIGGAFDPTGGSVSSAFNIPLGIGCGWTSAHLKFELIGDINWLYETDVPFTDQFGYPAFGGTFSLPETVITFDQDGTPFAGTWKLTASGSNFKYGPNTYKVNVTGTNATVTPPSGTEYYEGASVTVTGAPIAAHVITSAVVDGNDVLSSILTGGYTFSMPAYDVAGAIVASPESVAVSGSYTAQATGCKLSPYANLGGGNVLIQPKAFIYANGTMLSNGGTLTVDTGTSVAINVSTESIYTRISSMIVNGTQYAGPGTNYATRTVNITANTDVTVAVAVVADRFCYQVVPTPTGTPPVPQKPITPTQLTPIIPDPTQPPPPTKKWPPDPEDDDPPPPTDIPDPTDDPDPPPEDYDPPTGDLTDYIDFKLIDRDTDVELTKVGGVYQARNTQWIEYVPLEGDAPYRWVFGDKSADSTDASPTHRYYFSGDNLFAVTYYAYAEFEPGIISQGWVTKLVHVTEDITVPTTHDPDEPWTLDPNPSWPDLFRSGMEGLIIRWRDESGNWSKERRISLDRKDPHALLTRLGEYRVRQWEIVMVDSVPCVVCYLEEEVEVMD